MDTRYLQCFIAAAECKSLAEVARRFNITPAAVAARIKALEQQLGVPLIQRDGRHIAVTQAGQRVLERARKLVRDSRDLQVIAGDEHAMGEFRVGASTSTLTTLLPKVLTPLYKRYPKLSVFVEPGTSAHLYHQVTRGMLDAAIIVQPQFAVPKGFEWQLLVEDALTVLVPAHMKDRDPFEVLEIEPFLRYDRTTWGGRMADQYLQRHDIYPQQRLEIDGASAIAYMVASGLGVSLIPRSLADPSETKEVACLRLPGDTPRRRMGIIWAVNRAQTSLSQFMVEEAVKALSPSPN